MKQLTILIVDDEKEITSILSEFFSRSNVTCDSAYNGKEAWEKLQSKLYDILVTDVIMPEMSGQELIKNIDENLEYKLPIFVMTGFSDYSKLKFIESRGSNIYQKTDELRLLIDAVNEKIDQLSK